MKKIPTFLLLCAGLAALCVWAHAAVTFEEAGQNYRKGEFSQAARAYEDLLGTAEKNSALYYNLGNAYFRMGRKGKALAAYERALRLAPRDKDIRWNLQVLKSSLTDRIEVKGRNVFQAWISGTAGFFTIDEIAVLFSLALILSFLASLLVWLLGRQTFLTRTLRVSGVLFLVLFGSLFAARWLDVKDPRAIVLEKEVFALYGPSMRETKAFALHEGAEGRVIDRSREWVYVVLADKKAGWIPLSSCEIV